MSSGATRVVAARFERLTGEPLDSWAGLDALVAQQVPEATDLDYKLRPYDDPKKPKDERNDELRKDVTALANAIGGVIVSGISDSDGLPGKLLGFAGSLDDHEGRVRSVIRSHIWPPLDGVELVPVRDPGSTAGAVLIVVPASARAPHAVQPHADAEALKYARRVGRHTEWLSETQVADLYRARFTSAMSQSDRAAHILDDLRGALCRRGWLLVALVPDQPGEFTVSRDRLRAAEAWWNSRRWLDLFPGSDSGSANASAGPRRVVLARSDGKTSVSTGVYAELHDDGACGIALELRDAPSGNPSLYLDDLVTLAADAVVWAADFTVGQARAGGYGLLRSALHFPEHDGGTILAFDPSWSNPQPLPSSTTSAHTSHTIDTEAVHASHAEAVAATALVAGHLAQFFGLPDAQYLTPAGAVRVNQYAPQERDRRVAPRATELGVPTDPAL